MFLHILSGIIFCYLLFRLIIPMRARFPVKLVAGLGLFLISQHHLFLRTFFGSLASPEAPSPVLIAQNFLFASLVFLFLMVALRDATLLAKRAIKGARSKESPASAPGFSPGRRRALLLGLSALPAAYGIRQALDLPQIRGSERVLADLPKELNGLCIAHLSDLHIGPLLQEAWSAALVDKVNDLRPDLILFSGDLVDGLPGRRTGSVAHLKRLRAAYGVFACVGNHEYYADFQAWMRTFPKLGLTMLLNSHQTLNIRGQKLVIAGITDIAAERFGLPGPDCGSALDKAPEATTRILLSHRPAGAKNNARFNFALQLSGHTHGGQIQGLNHIIAQFNEGYLRGWYKTRDMSLYVNAGAGLWSGFPLRLGVPSEIARITLRCA